MPEVAMPAGIEGLLGGMEGFIFAVPFIIATAIMGLVLFLVIWKTPVLTFLRAWIGGSNIIAMKRKDGVLDLTLAKYVGGLYKSKYGVQIQDEGSAMPEKKSGARIAFATDSIGITLHPKMMEIINALKKDERFNDVKEIVAALDYYRTCKKCGYEGLSIPVFKTESVEIGDLKEDKKTFSHLECAKCNAKTLERAFPKVDVPLYETLSLEDYDKYFKYNYTPSRNDVIIEREVKAQMAKQRQFPVKWIAIAMAFAIIIIGLMIGMNIYQSNTLTSDPNAMLNYCSALINSQQVITG